MHALHNLICHVNGIIIYTLGKTLVAPSSDQELTTKKIVMWISQQSVSTPSCDTTLLHYNVGVQMYLVDSKA